MLPLKIKETELFDESTNTFINVKEQILRLEHSLVSISKWEAKWEKPFLSDTNKSNEELIDYIRFMTLNQNVDDNVYNPAVITENEIGKVLAYIKKPMTAAIFSVSERDSDRKSYLSAEIIYYKMFSYNISIECQKWHLNRLLALIRTFDIKNNPGEKMSLNEIYERNRQLNEMRKKKYNTKG